MAIDATTLTEYTWPQIATAAKVAMMNAAVGGTTLTIDGRTLGRITISEAKLLYETAQEQIALDGDMSGGIALIQWGEAQ
jgi:hypothetical protein